MVQESPVFDITPKSDKHLVSPPTELTINIQQEDPPEDQPQETQIEEQEIQQKASLGLVKELTNYISYGNNADPLWHELLSLVVTGTVIGPDIYTICAKGKIKANLMGINVGPSSLVDKTTAKNPAEELLAEVEKRLQSITLEKYHFPSKEQFSEEMAEHNSAIPKEKQSEDWKKRSKLFKQVEKELENILMPPQFSSEGLISYLVKHPNGAIFGDEFTDIYKGYKGKDYMGNVMETLTKLWDGKIPKSLTIKRGMEDPDEVYISMVSASTNYLLELMSQNFFYMGIGNRILWIYSQNIKKIEFDFSFWFTEMIIEEREKKKQDFINKLIKVRALPKGFVPLSFDAMSILEKFRVELHNKAVDIFLADNSDPDSSYLSRLTQNCFKFALIHCVGRYSEEADKPDKMEINDEDAYYAVSMAERFFEHFKAMYLAKTELSNNGSTRSFKDDYQRIKKLISMNSGEMTVSDIKNKTGWKPQEILRLLDDLIYSGEVKLDQRNSKNNKLAVYYSLKETTKDSLVEPTEPLKSFDLSLLTNSQIDK